MNIYVRTLIGWVRIGALLLFMGGVAYAQQTKPADSSKTFVGTQYFHIIEGRDQGHNIGTVLAGIRIAGTNKPTRWYLGAEMSDQQSPAGQGGVGPSLIMVSDIRWFESDGQPVMSVIGSISWINAAEYDPETQKFSWGLWTGLGFLFQVSDAAKITIAAKGTPTADGFISNIGIGPGLFITDPERRIAEIVKGAADVVGGLFGQ